MPTREQVIEAMKTVKDPEIQVDIWTLGLVYAIDIKDQKTIHVKMTLTTPFCPFGPQIMMDLKAKLMKLGFKDPNIELVFDPPWEPSDEVRDLLGLPS